MPTTEQDLKKVQAKREAASKAVQSASDYTGASYTLNDDIMNAVRNDRAQRGISGMATAVGQTSSQLVTDPADIKARTGDMVNPMTVDQLTSRARGQNLGTLSTLATEESRNTGTLQEIIEAGANRMRREAENKMAQAQKEIAEADALMEQLNYQEQVRQFNETLAEQQRQFNAKQSGGDGGLEGLLQSLLREQPRGGTPSGDDGDEFIPDGGKLQPTQGSLVYSLQGLKELYMPKIESTFNKSRNFIEDYAKKLFTIPKGPSW